MTDAACVRVQRSACAVPCSGLPTCHGPSSSLCSDVDPVARQCSKQARACTPNPIHVVWVFLSSPFSSIACKGSPVKQIQKPAQAAPPFGLSSSAGSRTCVNASFLSTFPTFLPLSPLLPRVLSLLDTAPHSSCPPTSLYHGLRLHTANISADAPVPDFLVSDSGSESG